MSETDDVAAAEAARAQAEARRKRIMEKANKRMNLVSGETAVDDQDKQVSQSNAARIRAARNRRYRKKAFASADATAAAADGAAPVADFEKTAREAPQSAAPAADNRTPAGTRATQDSQRTTETPSTEATASPSVRQTFEAAASVPAETDSTETNDDNNASDQANADKKRYLGVAKMRRKKLMERKKSNTASLQDIPLDEPDIAARTEAHKHLPPTHRSAVYMHIFTVLLLLVAGIDVGVQVFRDNVTVHTDNVLSQHGLPVLHRHVFSAKPVAFDKLVQDDSNSDTTDSLSDEDEFDIDEGSVEQNIDPIFGVDLDQLTKDPTVLNTMARGAIAVHRLNLRIFYYMPIGVLHTLMALPQTLITTPPVLCIVALVLRQIVGKTVLGADIPVPDEGEKKKDGAIDLVAMAKNGISSFMSSTFPTAVAVYDAFTHLRSDMYVVMCGVFIGILYTHTLGSTAGDTALQTASNDEL